MGRKEIPLESEMRESFMRKIRLGICGGFPAEPNRGQAGERSLYASRGESRSERLLHAHPISKFQRERDHLFGGSPVCVPARRIRGRAARSHRQASFVQTCQNPKSRRSGFGSKRESPAL